VSKVSSVVPRKREAAMLLTVSSDLRLLRRILLNTSLAYFMCYCSIGTINDA
jgi:hypothetical protein